MRRVLLFLAAVAVIAVTALTYWLFRPLPNAPEPAAFHCLPTGPNDGTLFALDLSPARVIGMGMTYSGHIAETASTYDPELPPPVFAKAQGSILEGRDIVAMPAREDFLRMAERLEPGLAATLDAEFPNLPVLLDYEVELGFVLLEDVSAEQLAKPDYAPALGYFIANDLSSRSFQVLGRNQQNRYDYWGAAKSFPGFMQTGDRMWVPATQQPNSVLCTTISTTVNGEIRQQQSTADLIYTPKQMLRFIARAFPGESLARGDVVLTGTPPGVALVLPRWRVRFSELVGFSRMRTLSMAISTYDDDPRFLQPGDYVTISSPVLGSASVTITD